MAIFIMRGGFNQLLPPTEPVIVSVSPAAIPAGQTATVTVVGANTNFVQGTTVVNYIPGFTVVSYAVTSPTTLTITLTAPAVANPQPESVWITTGTEEAVLPNALSVH